MAGPVQLPARLGKYELLEFLGGGMSHVYRARDTVIGRTVAVKILTDQGCADQEAKTRFLAEAQMSATIDHDNVIRIYDYGEEHGRPFLVMEFLVGEDLRKAIAGGTVGDLDSRLRIALQVARALEYVHSKRIVHRDLKPENIHLDARGRAKLMDFGIAKAEGLSLTRAGFALGTPYYMAPEQVLGEAVTGRADVYSFGILLFELLSGTKPVSGDTVERLFYAILNEPLNLQPLAQLGVPEPVRNLIARCTAKKAADRPAGFAEVIAELERATRAAPAEPAPAPARRSGKKAAMAIGVFAIASALALIWNFNRPKPPPPVLDTSTGVMMLVPEGEFLYGPDKKREELPSYYIDRTEVTNAAYAKFSAATGRSLPPGFPENRPDDPVVNVTIADAQQFARWANKRLPTAMEWERAARGTDGRTYPWGNDSDASKANLRGNNSLPQSGIVRAAAFDAGASPVRALNMAGNVWEVTADTGTPSPALIAHFSVIVQPPPGATEPWYTMRGGSFNTPLSHAVTYEWSTIPARFHAPDIGFRCVRDVRSPNR